MMEKGRFGYPVIDMTGKTYGRLTVIKRAPNDKGGHARWLCKCTCGNYRVVDGRSLRLGRQISCGCNAKEQFRKNIVIPRQEAHKERIRQKEENEQKERIALEEAERVRNEQNSDYGQSDKGYRDSDYFQWY